jgi:hypothetical protein
MIFSVMQTNNIRVRVRVRVGLGCRVAKTEHKEVYMYRRTVSSSVESMN